MGRFYKTADAKYLNDFIYQPNFELAQKVLEKKDRDAKNTLSQIKLMQDIPIDAWEVDKDLAEEKSRYYEESAADIYEAFKKNVNDPDAIKKLKKVQSTLKEDWTKGDLYKIRQNAQKYKEFHKTLEAMSPNDQKMYMKKIDEYKANNPNGALDSIFDYGKLYGEQDYMGKFLQSDYFKKLQKDLNITDEDKTNGKWIEILRKQRGGLGLQKVQEAFKSFLEGTPELKESMQVRQQYSEGLPFEEKYFDEDGNLLLNDKNSTIGKLYNNLDAYTYRDDKDIIAKKTLRQDYLARLRESMIRGRSAASGVDNKPIGMIDSSPFYKYSVLGKQQMIQYNYRLRSMLEKIGVPFSKSTRIDTSVIENIIQQKTKYLMENGTPKQKKIAQNLYNNYYTLKQNFNDEMQGWETQFAAAGYNTKDLDRVNKLVKSKKDILLNQAPGVFMIGEGTGFKPLIGSGDKMLHANEAKKTIVTYNGKKYKIKEIKNIDDPSLVLGGMFSDKYSQNGVQPIISSAMEYTLVPVEEEKENGAPSLKDYMQGKDKDNSIKLTGVGYFDDAFSIGKMLRK